MLNSTEPQTIEAHGGDVRNVSFSPDGKLLASGSSDKTVKLWQVEDGKLLQTLEGHRSLVRSVSFSPVSLASPEGVGRILAVRQKKPHTYAAH
nr:hypothetical protein [Moorena producens]